MLCSIHKRKISRAMDSGKPLSGRERRHLRHCAACREFARQAGELEGRLTRDAAALLAEDQVALGKKVLLSLDRRVESRSGPKRILGRPAWAIAAAAAVVLVAVVVASRTWLVAPRTEKTAPLESLLNYDAPGVYLKKAVQKAESPYQQEIRELRKAIGAAAGVIEASFDIGLAEKT